jgi:hypothetical protein
MDRLKDRARLLAPVALIVSTACSGGINAGEKGGVAFVAFAGMLLLVLGIMWLVLGRD